MNKKLIALLLAVLMAFALAACGGSDTSAAEAETDKTAASDIGETGEGAEGHSDEMLSLFSYAYAGIGDDGNYYFMAFDEDVSYSAFVILSEDGTQSLNAVGALIDNGDSTVTIDDSYSGYSITFATEFPEEGGMIMTLTDGTVVTMGGASVSDVVEIIRDIDNNTEIINPLAE